MIQNENTSTLVSVVIPALNEAKTIGSVVQFALESAGVGEVIVVDDGSIDGTPELARSAGARVVTSTLLGKGASMEDGLREAHFETLVYLDGDLKGLESGVIEKLIAPILEDEADFVKAKFTRAAGRVTVLTARPLLRTHFPELSDLTQPLSGIMAARKSLLQRLKFENDYGVDVGLLIDALAAGGRIREIDIGHIEHHSQSLEALAEMAVQVSRTILERAARLGRLTLRFIRQAKEGERMAHCSTEDFLRRISHGQKLALFDMDGVILNGRFIVALAESVNKREALHELLDNPQVDAEVRCRKIARLFRGVRQEQFEEIARNIPLNDGAAETVIQLRKSGYRVGIITDSYDVVSEIVRRRVFADFSFAHVLGFRQARATGTLMLCPVMQHSAGCNEHHVCKVNALQHLAELRGIRPEEIIAIGDGENDICLLKAAGASYAYHPKSRAVGEAAQQIITDLREVSRLQYPTIRLEVARNPRRSRRNVRLGLRYPEGLLDLDGGALSESN